MAKREKPATAGEKIEMKRCGLTLEELRSSGNRADALNVDRAIARAVRKDRKRCVRWIDAYAVSYMDLTELRSAISGDKQP